VKRTNSDQIHCLKEKLMECSTPGVIRDEELLAYAAGEKVRPVVEPHLAQCQRCSTWVAEYRGLERSLIQKLYRWDCPPNQILGEYQMGLLGSDVAKEVQSHLKTCVLCAAEVATFIEFIANDPMLVDRVAVQPSSQNNHSGVKQHVKRTLEDLRERSATQVRRIAASLVPQQPRFAHQRHVTNSAVWPRRYTVEDFSISMQLERGTERNDALQLIGLVTRNGASLEALQGIPVSLSSQTSPVYTQMVDELGNFVFSSISPATYSLELQLPDTTIVIEQLPIDLQD
jgi:anti-sigma factor RsiW